MYANLARIRLEVWTLKLSFAKHRIVISFLYKNTLKNYVSGEWVAHQIVKKIKENVYTDFIKTVVANFCKKDNRFLQVLVKIKVDF